MDNEALDDALTCDKCHEREAVWFNANHNGMLIGFCEECYTPIERRIAQINYFVRKRIGLKYKKTRRGKLKQTAKIGAKWSETELRDYLIAQGADVLEANIAIAKWRDRVERGELV